MKLKAQKCVLIAVVVGLIGMLLPMQKSQAQSPQGACMLTAYRWALATEYPPAKIRIPSQPVDILLDTQDPNDAARIRQLLRAGISGFFTKSLYTILVAEYIAQQLNVNGFPVFPTVFSTQAQNSGAFPWIKTSDLVALNSDFFKDKLPEEVFARVQVPPSVEVSDYLDAADAVLRFGGSVADQQLVLRNLRVVTGDAPYGVSLPLTHCSVTPPAQ